MLETPRGTMRFLKIPDDDPWTVSHDESLHVVSSQGTQRTTGHASRLTTDGRIDVQREGDGVTGPYAIRVRFFPDDDHAPRHPTFDEILEACDRMFPIGSMAAPPGWVCGQYGARRPDPVPGAGFIVFCVPPGATPSAPAPGNGLGIVT